MWYHQHLHTHLQLDAGDTTFIQWFLLKWCDQLRMQPVTLPACDPNITASNECGPISVTYNVGTIQVNGCNRQQTLTYVANAVGCGTFSTCIKIHNWQVTTAPVFANCDNTHDLGCNLLPYPLVPMYRRPHLVVQ